MALLAKRVSRADSPDAPSGATEEDFQRIPSRTPETWIHHDRARVEPRTAASKTLAARHTSVVAGRGLITGVEIVRPACTAHGRALDASRSNADFGFAIKA